MTTKMALTDVYSYDPPGSEPFHWRVSYNRETYEIYFVSVNTETGEPEAFTLTNIQPLLGHTKTDGCCN